MEYPFEIYVTGEEEPNKEVIEDTLNKIYHDTGYGDYGPVDVDRIQYIVFMYEDGKWTYVWDSKGSPSFERIRRITGYLTGTLDRFNNAKRHEEHDRVKHSFKEE